MYFLVILLVLRIKFSQQEGKWFVSEQKDFQEIFQGFASDINEFSFNITMLTPDKFFFDKNLIFRNCNLTIISNSDSKLIFNEFFLQFYQTNVVFMGIIFSDILKVKPIENISYLFTLIGHSSMMIQNCSLMITENKFLLANDTQVLINDLKIRSNTVENLSKFMNIISSQINITRFYILNSEYHNFSKFFYVESSEVIFSELKMYDLEFYNTDAVFNFVDSSLYMKNSTFSAMRLSQSLNLFSMSSKNGDNKILRLKINDCFFYNISSNINFESYIFNICLSFQKIEFDNAHFKKIRFIINIIYLISISNEMFLFQNLKFIDNSCKNNLFMESSLYIMLYNVSCINNNLNYVKGEACFFLKNIFYRQFSLLSIINCFSNTTSAGIIIYDYDQHLFELNYLKKNYTVIFEQCDFHKNNVFASHNDKFLGTAIKIISKAFILISHSRFSYNYLISDHQDQFSIGGPCLISENANLIIILFSHFRMNRSTKLSNCLLIYSKSLFISNSIFFNNTVSTITDEMFQDKFKRRWYVDDAYEWDISEFSDNSKGGAIFFSGNELVVNSTCFSDNKANFGSAIYTNDEFLSSDEQTLLFFNCSFSRQDAITRAVFFTYLQSKKLFFYCYNSILHKNNALDGSVINLYLPVKSKIFFHKNFLISNVGNFGPIYVDSVGSGTFYLSSNTYTKNIVQAIFLPLGCTIINFMNPGSKALLAHERAYKNDGLQGLHCVYEGTVLEEKSIYIKNSGFDGSILALLTNGKFAARGSVYSDNESGIFGCFLLLDLAQMTIEDSIIRNCTSQGSRGAIFLSQWEVKSYIVNVFILYNNNPYGNIFDYNINSEENFFINCSFAKNSGKTGIFDIVNTSFRLINPKIYSNEGSILSLFESDDTLLLAMKGFKLQMSMLSEKMYLFEIRKSINVKIENFSFYNISEGFLFAESSQIELKNDEFQKITSNKKATIIFSQDSLVRINDCRFSSFELTSFYLLDSRIFIYNSFFNYGEFRYKYHLKEPEYGMIFAENCLEMELGKSIFINFKNATSGGVIFSQVESFKSSNIYIVNCLFLNNSISKSGGVLHLIQTNILIRKSIFKSNEALLGGSIFLQNADFTANKIQFYQTSFINNQARKEGGAVKWTFLKPEFKNCTFQDNIAPYGNNIASFPVRFWVQFYDHQKKNLLYDTNSTNNSYTKYGHASGSLFENSILLKLLDCDGQIVTTAAESFLSIKLSYLNDSIDQTSYFSADEELIIKEGSLMIDQLKINALPNTYISMMFTTKAIGKYYSHLISLNLERESGRNNEYNFFFMIFVRKCVSGEIYRKKTFACVPCPDGKISLGENSLECLPCSAFMKCISGKKSEVLLGYWRSSPTSFEIHKCRNPYKDVCLGGVTGECLVGYDGPLCDSCININGQSFYKLSQFCLECPKISLSTVYVFLYILGSSFLVFFTIKSFSRETSKLSRIFTSKKMSDREFANLISKNNLISIYMKIFLTFSQLVNILYNVKVSWPLQITNFFNYFGYVTLITQNSPSLECFAREFIENVKPSYAQVIFKLLLLFGSCVVSFIVWGIIGVYKQNSSKIFISKLVSTIIIIFEMYLASTINQISKSIQCNEIGKDKYYSNEDTTIECDSKEFIFYKNIVAYPNLIILGGVFPFLCFFLLWKNKNKLNSFDMRTRFGFLYNGYRISFYYWEFLILSRHLLLIILFSMRINIKTQILVSVLIILLFTLLHFYNMPYFSSSLNNLEVKALNACFLTIMFSYIFNENDELYLNLIASFIIVLSNLVFIVSFLLNFSFIFLYTYESKILKYAPCIAKTYIFLTSLKNSSSLKEGLKPKQQTLSARRIILHSEN